MLAGGRVNFRRHEFNTDRSKLIYLPPWVAIEAFKAIMANELDDLSTAMTKMQSYFEITFNINI